jgi:hypothetical protein
MAITGNQGFFYDLDWICRNLNNVQGIVNAKPDNFVPVSYSIDLVKPNGFGLYSLVLPNPLNQLFVGTVTVSVGGSDMTHSGSNIGQMWSELQVPAATSIFKDYIIDEDSGITSGSKFDNDFIVGNLIKVQMNKDNGGSTVFRVRFKGYLGTVSASFRNSSSGGLIVLKPTILMSANI